MKDWRLLGTSPLRASLWKAVGGYDEAKWLTNSVQDMDFWIRVLKRGFRGAYLPGTIYRWAMHESNMHAAVPPDCHARLALRHRNFYATRQSRDVGRIVNENLNILWRLADRGTFADAAADASDKLDLRNKLSLPFVEH